MISLTRDHNGVPVLHYRNGKKVVLLCFLGGLLLTSVVISDGPPQRWPHSDEWIRLSVMVGGGLLLLDLAAWILYRPRIFAVDSRGFLLSFPRHADEVRLHAWRNFVRNPCEVQVYRRDEYFLIHPLVFSHVVFFAHPYPEQPDLPVDEFIQRAKADRLVTTIQSHFRPSSAVVDPA